MKLKILFNFLVFVKVISYICIKIITEMSIAIDTELMIKVEMASTFDLNEAFPILQQLFALRQQIADDILIHKYDRDSEAYRMLDHINDRIKYVLGL